LAAYFKVSDIALVTPLKDGMNIVAKEYLSVKGSEGGFLILSKKAGAAVELQDACQVNPDDDGDILNGLMEGLMASKADKITRNAKMVDYIDKQTTREWSICFLQKLTGKRMKKWSPRKFFYHFQAKT
jgi:trehalose 6-phosphate synthase/phosphatase